jgi:hypothetical protein
LAHKTNCSSEEERVAATTQNRELFTPRNATLLALLLIVVPPSLFYILLLRSQTSLPFLDDYGAVLAFMLRLKPTNLAGRLALIFTTQDNEYRLIFENAIYVIQYSFLKHADLKTLSLLGDLLVLPIFGVLYLIWRSAPGSAGRSLLAFAPVSWILFQLQYASTLNCVMTPLQHLSAILFVLLSLYLGSRKENAAFAGACLSFAFAVAASGNGMFLLPLGGMMFLQKRAYKRLAVWITTGLILCLAYFYKYDFNNRQSQIPGDHSLLASIGHLSPIWAASFLGSIVTVRNVIPAIILGAVFVVLFIFATHDKLFDRNPPVYYAMLFFLVTSIMVSAIRSGFGLASSLGSRYRINSALMLILAYLYLLDKVPQLKRQTVAIALCIGVPALAAFTFISDAGGYKLLLIRRAKLETAMYRWENHLPKPPLERTELTDMLNMTANEKKGYYEPMEPTLSNAINAGIYQLPQAEIDRGAVEKSLPQTAANKHY